MHLDITRIIHGLDPDVLVAEYTSEGHVTTTSKPYANSYIAIVRFRDELICAQTGAPQPGAGIPRAWPRNDVVLRG